ncbi:maleylpyruvate isomerase family mycothiol-dependent enzyme [Aldersonia sp. NBC_00410]|uniref:maleylpyruvate isomerase family mycothiol-dependent enzyme n=1 Tax=Aldersonia sp. NBC_00410 TaxID=2975954 RepID=UPI0022588546|nr:maleylpyruvate isomerase family mycothiol-dependent enzyme [Aldersonia sp. NBC_00410]MCX5043639.1 maleylpyruvate isomerase family mycothiol-dependent enzyme [Aldersonia sp. NBC_00410]
MTAQDTPLLDQKLVTNALLAQWDVTDSIVSGLDAHGWRTPTPLPGWTVQDVVSHIIGTESMLLGIDPPKAELDAPVAHVRNEIGGFNELWVEGLRDRSGEQMLAQFRDVTGQRRRILTELTAEQWAAPSWSPIGQTSYGRFMRIRLFDCWMHELDIRDGLRRSGEEGDQRAELAFPEIEASIGFIVGKLGKAPDGARVTLELTGPLAQTIHVAVDGRAKRVRELDGPATTTLTLDSRLFVRLVGGRTTFDEHRDEIGLDGDAELAEQLARRLAFTI